MAKTRSQYLRAQIKKEESEDKPKLNQLPHRTNNTKKARSKITKKEKIAKIEPMQAHISKVKSENIDENKVNLALPMRNSRRSKITIEQLTKLIGYIINDKMTVKAASRKAKMGATTARRYYKQYQKYPKHNIPLPKSGLTNQSSRVTQKKIEDMINYIAHDKMSVTQAAYKVNMSRQMADKYYKRYMEDPDRKIPILDISRNYLYKRCTQEEINELIGYIVNNNMSVKAAAKKTNMDKSTAKKYYLKYLDDPNHEIPVPGTHNINGSKKCTNQQVEKLIGLIVDGMTLKESSIKANMGEHTARKYYRQYLDDPDHKIPTPENSCDSNKLDILDRVKKFFSFIIIDKMAAPQASRKANIPAATGYRLYRRYLDNPTKEDQITNNSYSPEKMKKLIEYIQNDNNNIALAAKKAELGYDTALKYYRQYMNDPQHKISIRKVKRYTQEDVKRLIDYIERDKMRVSSAGRKTNMSESSARQYYKAYLNDPEHKIPLPMSKHKLSDQYAQIIADIYKSNPMIKPVQGNHHSYSDLPDINIKQEHLEAKEDLTLSV